jgi:hypothetical protein
LDLPDKENNMALKRVATSMPTIPKATTSLAMPAKQFYVDSWNGGTEGEKIIIYADSGMGKTTLASMAPKPVFIGLDNGGRKLLHPKTGQRLNFIPDIETFADVRAVLQQEDLWTDHQTAVIDTVTILEELAIPHVLETTPNDKGVTMKNILQYGYNKGYRHLYDVMKLILQDCDVLVKRGKNIIFIAQENAMRVPNAAGEDYLRSGPRLTANKEANIEGLYCEWADHVMRVAYNATTVKDKKVLASDERVVYVKGEAHFRAKSRTLPHDISCVTFESPSDDSIWKFIFPEK